MSSILGNFLAGQQAGRQQHQYRQEQSKMAQLQQLAPSVLAGDPAAYGKSMALDSAHTERLQDGRTKQLGQLEGMVKFVDAARATNDPRQLAGAMRTIAPFMKTLTGQDIDPDAPWTPEYDTGWEAFKAQIAGARGAGTQPTQFAALDLQARAAGYEPGTQGYQDFFKRANGELARQSGAAIGYQKITGPDGREYLVATDPRGIGAQVVGDGTGYGSFSGQQPMAAAPAAAPQRADMEADIELANSMIAAGIPEAQVDAFLAQRGQRAPAPSGGQGSPMPAGAGSAGGNPFASRRPEDQAAATERAKLQAQAEYLPQELAMRGQAAVEQAVGIERGKNEAERDAQAPKRIQSYQQALAASQNVATSIDKALGMIGPMSTGFLGARSRGIEGSPAYNLAAEIETVKANLGFDRLQQMRDNSPTGGALGAIAVQELVALQSTIANLDPNQSDDQLRANLGRVKEHYDRWRATVQQALADEQSRQRQGGRQPATQSGQQPAGGQPSRSQPPAAPVQRARNPQTGQVVEFRNGQWVPVQ